MTARSTPLFIGSNPPNNSGPWVFDFDGNGVLTNSVTPEGYFEILLDDEAALPGSPMTRYTYTVPITNTSNPDIILAASVAFASSECDWGVVIEGSTGQISANFSILTVSNGPATFMKLHTGIADRGTQQNPVSGGPMPESGVLWVRLTHDKTDSNRSRMYFSCNGIDWLQSGADEFLDIGTLQRCGINMSTDTDTNLRARILQRVYNFEQS